MKKMFLQLNSFARSGTEFCIKNLPQLIATAAAFITATLAL
jgi:hypothetical protein